MNLNDFSHKDLRYYLAYGSNLNLAQMQERCGTSKKVGKAIIKDYRLMFKGSENSNYLTIEKAKGYQVPVGVFIIQEGDEVALDRFEGFPFLYYKQDFVVELITDNGNKTIINAFAYIMHEDRKLGAPSEEYVRRVQIGYKNFGFDKKIIDEAIEFSVKEAENAGESAQFDEK